MPVAAKLMIPTALLPLMAGCLAFPTFRVTPAAETAPVPSMGDAADDLAIWIHPSNPALSTIIATDKFAGLLVYDLAGERLQFLPGGTPNNVDVRYGFPLGGERVDLVAASNRTEDCFLLYRVNAANRRLEPATEQPIAVGIHLPYGLCLYHSRHSGKYYAFVGDHEGRVEQWELSDDGKVSVAGTLARAFDVGWQAEGMVADDEAGVLYIAEEWIGIWRYGAEPDAGTARVLVDTTRAGGHLRPDVEGLALYCADGGAGYLIAACQGNSTFVIYRREGDNDFVASFQVVAGNGIDGVGWPDGIDITNVALGPAFPLGVFITHDHLNSGQPQNFKLVAWETIATAADPPLTIDTAWNPRGDSGTSDERRTGATRTASDRSGTEY